LYYALFFMTSDVLQTDSHASLTMTAFRNFLTQNS
jgi:hypothetical protein